MNVTKINIDVLTGEKPIPEVTIEALDRFHDCILNQHKDYPLPTAVINIVQDGETIPLLTLKAFSLWQGKQKTKKTTALAMAMAAYITDNVEENYETTYLKAGQQGCVLWADTEQGESYGARTMKLLLKLASCEHSEKLIYCDLRELSPVERMEVIITGIKTTPDLKIVVIDGLVDLLDDFMDARQGHTLITTILKLCSQYNIHVAGVLHQNKAKEDKSARAHVGTIASQKCEIEISAEADSKDLSLSRIQCLNSRALPFKDFSIRWEKGSLPHISSDQDDSIQKPAKSYSQGLMLLDTVFSPLAAFGRTEAEEFIMNELKVSESTAKRRMNELISWKLIEKNGDGRYRRVQGS